MASFAAAVNNDRSTAEGIFTLAMTKFKEIVEKNLQNEDIVHTKKELIGVFMTVYIEYHFLILFDTLLGLLHQVTLSSLVKQSCVYKA